MKKRILFFIQNGVGGAERMTINIAQSLDSSQYEIIFCKVSMPYLLQNGRIDDFIPKEYKLTNIFFSGQISFLFQLYKVIKKFKPDIVFSSVMPYNQRLLFLKPLFKHTVFIVRNDNYLFTVNRLKQNVIKYTYRKASKIIAQTEEMKEELIGLGLNPEKIIVLHNFIDEKLIADKASIHSPFSDEPKIRFVSVGRIAPQKGFDILINAFKTVVQELPNAELYIIGDITGVHEEEYRKLKSLTVELELSENVIFTGYTPNPYSYIKNANVYVLSSRFEGLPNVLIEAQFLGTPSAATKCVPIISRMIRDGENGYLAESENAESLANAMIAATKIHSVNPVYQSSSLDDFRKIFSN